MIMLDRTSPNPRERIGVFLALKSVEEERDSKVRPLNEQVTAINAEYHRWFSTNDKKPGLWGTLLKELKVRLTAFARAEEQKRREAAEAARKAAEEAERKSQGRAPEDREREAAAEAAQGVCDVDIAAATEQADQAFRDFQRADRQAQRAQRDTHVRIGGGLGKVSTLRNVEVLSITDIHAAIEDVGVTDAIRDAVLSAARAYRRENNGARPKARSTGISSARTGRSLAAFARNCPCSFSEAPIDRNH